MHIGQQLRMKRSCYAQMNDQATHKTTLLSLEIPPFAPAICGLGNNYIVSIIFNCC